MISTIKIQHHMDCNYICNKIHRAILDYQKDNPDLTDSIVIIDIRKPYDAPVETLRLEHNNSNLAN